MIRKLVIQGFRSFQSEVVEFDNPTFLVGCNGSGKSNLLDALAFLSEAMTTRLTEVFAWRGGGRVVCHGSSTLPNGEDHRTLGLEVVLGPLGHDIASASYAFQIAVIGRDRSSYRVEREQCVIDSLDGQRIWFERDEDRTFRSNVAGLQPQLTDEFLTLTLVGGNAPFGPVYRALEGIRAYSIAPDRMRDWQVPTSGSASVTTAETWPASCERFAIEVRATCNESASWFRPSYPRSSELR